MTMVHRISCTLPLLFVLLCLAAGVTAGAENSKPKLAELVTLTRKHILPAINLPWEEIVLAIAGLFIVSPETQKTVVKFMAPLVDKVAKALMDVLLALVADLAKRTRLPEPILVPKAASRSSRPRDSSSSDTVAASPEDAVQERAARLKEFQRVLADYPEAREFLFSMQNSTMAASTQ